ncbi:MAG: sodium-dependent transporter [Eubacteriales bacterium]|nr:sodium-dependent transporter [Eubacteriales bacterium]
MEQRESLSGRIGFILLSAGCAIGIGNVWRFPYVVGNNGGGIFVLFYLLFLCIVGIPVLTMEFAIGRASRQSIVRAYGVLEKPGQKWHIHGYLGMFGNYMLMFYYTSVAGWMLCYFFKYALGTIEAGKETAADTAVYGDVFNALLGNPVEATLWVLAIVAIGFLICSLGLQKGVERITKWMMAALLILIIVLAVHSLTLPNAVEGLKFYLLPNPETVKEAGVFHVMVQALNQSFFTLSLGIGAMLIFGSYLNRKNTLLGQSIHICVLDTFVAVMAGLIIFPACSSFGVDVNSGPSLIFITLPNVFGSMGGGRIWGALFFLFMTFAALSTVIAVFENILACCMDRFHMTRKKACLVNFVIVALGSLPCVFGYNLLSGWQPLGAGSAVLDLEDFIVSNILLPFGSLIILLFCVTKRYGWGFSNYLKEANTGEGVKVPAWIRPYCTYILPVVLFVILVLGLIS